MPTAYETPAQTLFSPAVATRAKDQPMSVEPPIPLLARPLNTVLYLRVSSSSQVATDYDPEGISLPAQRRKCRDVAESRGDLTVIDEFVEPGESGRNVDNRPAFQAMLNRIRTVGDIDVVMVYKLSRLHRNRYDEAITMMELRKHGVALVSATESIDETPVGQLMQGILSAYNEYRSAEDGADIRYKMGQKAMNGGTLGRAPLGYINYRESYQGREIRSVKVDPERGPLITAAFSLYSTGRYTFNDLAEELADRGLTSRPGRYPAGDVSVSKIATMLRDRYYLGYITYKGVEYPGRHEPLVEHDTFERTQTVIAQRSLSGERRRVHDHYLKGTVWCGTCQRNGRQNRLIRTSPTGNGGTYDYFMCRGRQKHECDVPHIPVELVEQAVIDHYTTITFEPELAAKLRDNITDTLTHDQQAISLERKQLHTQLTRLEVAETNLIDLAADGTLPNSKIRTRLHDIHLRRARITEQLADVKADLASGARFLHAAIEFLEQPRHLYERLSDPARKTINQTIFERIYIDDDTVTDDQLREPFAELAALQRGPTTSTDTPPTDARLAQSARDCHATRKRKEALLKRALDQDRGLSRTSMVELRRIELLTSSMPWKRSTN
jgi:site-specific DNA recombinase